MFDCAYDLSRMIEIVARDRNGEITISEHLIRRRAQNQWRETQGDEQSTEHRADFGHAARA